jgi:hypothetical protein
MVSYAVLNFFRIIEIRHNGRAEVKVWFRDKIDQLRDQPLYKESIAEFLSVCADERPHEYLYRDCRLQLHMQERMRILTRTTLESWPDCTKRPKFSMYLLDTLYPQSLAFRTPPIPGIDELRKFPRGFDWSEAVNLSPLSGLPVTPFPIAATIIAFPVSRPPARRPGAAAAEPCDSMAFHPYFGPWGGFPRLTGARRRRDREFGLCRHPFGRERVEYRAVNAPPELPAKIGKATAERCPAIVNHAGEGGDARPNQLPIRRAAAIPLCSPPRN